MPTATSSSSSHIKQRIFHDSPWKVKSREGTFSLHQRTLEILDDVDCRQVLAEIGISKVVLISDAVGVLCEEMDTHFKSLSGLATFKEEVEIILGSIKSSHSGRSFSEFANVVYNGCKSTDGEIYKAITSSGMDLFWVVLEAAAETFLENQTLQWMNSYSSKKSEFEVLKLWSEAYVLLQGRHGKSHPFNFVGGDVRLAGSALEVFKFLVEENNDDRFKEMVQVMRVAVPHVSKKIEEKMIEETKAKKVKEFNDARIRDNLPARRSRNI